MRLRTLKNGKVTKCLATLLCLFLAMPLFTVPSVMAAPGDIIDNSGFIPFEQAYFAFEVESPIGTLKEVPIWDEIEKMLDDPYAIELDPTVAGNAQGWPSYRSTQPRRRSFIFRDAGGEPCAPFSAGCNEVPLSRHLVHPLNYNHSTGEELRLLNIEFGEGPWLVPDQLVQCGVGAGCPSGSTDTNRYEYTYRGITVSAGNTRIEDDEAAPDFNSPIAPDNPDTCVVTVDQFFAPGPGPRFFNPATNHWDLRPGGIATPEGSIVCGGDPGEPGYAGFGVLAGDLSTAYSTPAVPGPASPATSIIGFQLFDPVRGPIAPRNPVTGAGGLRKPSLRIPEVGGTGTSPNYAYNSAAQLEDRAVDAGDDLENAPAYLVPSNENDYVRNRDVAAALGKALFWDMQVGSDSVQACASCHFHAGADNRTKNQLNPNHLSGDFSFQITGSNTEVVPSHFPFHKLVDIKKPGEPLLNPENVISDANDVMSSMGVKFGKFVDIPAIGTRAFTGVSNGVSTLVPERRGFGIDPIPGFRNLRRVEPRNTPTLFASTMNFDNFWDGRARHDFNGGSVFGPSDPQHHVMVDMGDENIQATRQIIRFSSLASLATGPALSNFEMSFEGRNWAKIGKKLLQAGVVPLANQLVDPNDSVLGPYSNQIATPGKPGLNISYPDLIKLAFYPALWQNTTMHLNGTSAPCAGFQLDQRDPPQRIPGQPIPVGCDPFDGYVLSIAPGSVVATNTNQFTQMEANMPLFFGLSIQMWGHILIPDDSPMDRFFDVNPDSHLTFGESGEPGIAFDLLNCSGENETGGVKPCFTELGNFKRDSVAASPILNARIGVTIEGGQGGTLVASHGTRQPGAPDPLLGLDFFLGSNLSLKNPNFRSLRCGECHAGGTLTDHTFEISHQVSFGDRINEFVPGQPGTEGFPEALGRGRIISGFLLEGELQENAQDGLERNLADFRLDAGGFPKGQALFDNGVYNIGVRPIFEDVARGGDDPFGWPLSLSYLALKNLGGIDYHPGGDNPADGFAQPATPGIPLPNFDPSIDPTGGGLFNPTAQDFQINPGFGEEPANPLLPPYLAPWASNIPVGDESNIDELFVGLNTLMNEPMKEGFVDSWGPFNPAAIIGEAFNSSRQPEMATWPNVNRVNVQGSFKAPPLRNVELTGPYFHTGGKITLRQQLDFYMRGGDFPITNSAHRDFLIANLNTEDEALGGCVDSVTGSPVTIDFVTGLCPVGSEPEFTEAEKEEIRVAVVDFLLELTDERVKFERAPFDHPEIFVPLDGRAPDNTFGRNGFLTRLGMFRQVPAVGAGGNSTPLPNFLGIASRPTPGQISHHDSFSVPAQLTLIAPNGGEVFSEGNPISISWDGGPAGTKFYRLEYSTDGGGTWKFLNFISRRIAAANKSFTWTFPRSFGDLSDLNAVIRVSAVDSDGVIIGNTDISNAPFTILR